MFKRSYFNSFSRVLGALIFMTVFVCAVFVQQAAVEAANSNGRIVRVGYYHETNFQEGKDAQSFKKGYAYEYYQKLAHRTGWSYEYVYDEYDKLYAKLLKGEIDFLAGLGYVEARKQVLSYPELPMGYEDYDFVKRIGDKRLTEDVTSINGKKIGVLEGAMHSFLDKYLAEHKLEAQVITYKNMKLRDAALRNSEVDVIIAEDSMGDLHGVEAYKQLGRTGFYIAVNKQKPELLAELNAAQARVQEDDPNLLNKLRGQSFRRTAFRASLSEHERAWVDSHQELRIGYLAEFMPFSGTDGQGKVTGVVKDVTERLVQELRINDALKIKYVPYMNNNTATEDLRQGKIDVIFPMDADDWVAEQNGMQASEMVVSTPLNLVYKGNSVPKNITRLAASKRNIYQSILARVYYPKAELVVCETIEAGIEAVAEGKADGMLIYGARVNAVKNSAYEDLNATLIDSRACGYGVKSGNTPLLDLIDRGLGLMDVNYAQALLQVYDASREDATLAAFVRKHAGLAVAICLAIIALMLAVAYTLYKHGQQTKALNLELDDRNQQLQENQARLEELTSEQESQIEEITQLNNTLEENQAQLEEAAAENEAQLEEITAAKEELEASQNALEEAKKEAEAANNAKTSFLFNMSHDIRTPMNAIMGFRDLLEKHQEEPQKRADYLRKIEDSSNVLLSIINNVLEMARIEKGTVEVDETAWSAEQFNDTLYSVFYELMVQKGISFTHEIEVHNHYVMCDPIKLREVFLNILSNAYKYTNAGGRVHMRLEEVPSAKPGYAYYRTIISDTGIGMSEEFLPHIYEEFSREHSSTDAKIEGTGLGMPIVKRLVDLMQGTIEVTSAKGVGTTFVVTFPHRITDKSSLVEHYGIELDPKIFEGKRILLAEDNDLNAEIAQEILGEAGFIVERAEDGAICVDMLKKAPNSYYDLILMDIQMPNMNGYEATRSIRALPDSQKAQIKILAMTANAFEEDKREAYRSGMNGHLAKPVNVRELMRALAAILG